MEGGGGAMPAAPEDVMQINEAQASVVIFLTMSARGCLNIPGMVVKTTD